VVTAMSAVTQMLRFSRITPVSIARAKHRTVGARAPLQKKHLNSFGYSYLTRADEGYESTKPETPPIAAFGSSYKSLYCAV
ncbi:hypothetical protein QCD79_27750, partial [Pseudomonas quasicaspiana]|nr:hypothetical protein [Pseudomonas quasicaspiana]